MSEEEAAATWGKRWAKRSHAACLRGEYSNLVMEDPSAAGQKRWMVFRASEAYADPSTTSRPDLRSDLTADELELICEGCDMMAADWVRR